MLRASTVVCREHELLSGINIGRQALSSQFATMNGWQAGQSARFDAYIKEKRQIQHFEGFDQRVERAYRAVCKTHKAEILNSFKRQLKSSGKKFTAQSTMDIRKAVEDRQVWLREVWAQVDADYRSDDPTRQQVAAKEISAALSGEPSEYMAWVYDTKWRERFAGPKEKMELEAELSNAELPDVSADEVSRYQNLQVNMSAIEENVKRKYGLAGQQHWAALQAEKDKIYEEKLDHAARIYKQLLDQSARYDESRRTALLRSHVERVHQAQVRFRASMELEKEREKMIQAHAAMEEERKRIAKEDRIALLKEAAELKARGVPTPEIALAMKEKQLDRYARRQAEYQLAEQEKLRQAKNKYHGLLHDFKREMEEREGRELLGGHTAAEGQGEPYAGGPFDANGLTASASSSPSRSFSSRRSAPTALADAGDAPTGWRGELGERSASFAAGDASLEGALTTPTDHSSLLSSHGEGSPSDGVLSRPASSSPVDAGVSPSSSRLKNVLWEDVQRNRYEDPFLSVHQARLDAAKNYDAIYSKYFPTSLALGKKYSRQNTGEDAAGNEMDKQVFQKAGFVLEPYRWGVQSVHDLDSDGSINYLTHMERHVQDKRTGDIDWRYEKKKGGPVFRGPRLYGIGAQREAADPGERPIDPSYLPHLQQPSSSHKRRR